MYLRGVRVCLSSDRGTSALGHKQPLSITPGERLVSGYSGRSAHVSQALLIRGVHQSPTKSIARVLSNCSGESTTPCSSIRSITARWDRALYQYQPGSIGVSDVQWVDFTLSCYAMRHLCRLFSSSVVVRCPLCGLAQVSWTLSFRSILTCGGAP